MAHRSESHPSAVRAYMGTHMSMGVCEDCNPILNGFRF